MQLHGNARTTPYIRREMVRRVRERAEPVTETAAALSPLGFLDVGRPGDVHRLFQALSRWALVLMARESAIDSLSRSVGDTELVVERDPGQHGNPVDQLIYALDHTRNIGGRQHDLTHLQCAVEGAEHSRADGSRDVVDE